MYLCAPLAENNKLLVKNTNIPALSLQRGQKKKKKRNKKRKINQTFLNNFYEKAMAHDISSVVQHYSQIQV